MSKMTDEQIKKALKYCQDTEGDSCQCCEYLDVPGCQMELSKDALDLINRQQAEIERLKAEARAVDKDLQELDRPLTEIRIEAIKEFADRLKEHKYQSSDWSHGEHPFVVEESDIDNLVAEMVGDDK